MIFILLIVALFLVAIMSVTWFMSWRWKNAGIVDVVWAASFTVVVSIVGWFSHGDNFRRTLLVGMVSLWSLRLASHLFKRVKAHHPVEDSRYAAMRLKWGKKAEWNMFTFFQLQGLLILLLALPYFVVCRNSLPWLTSMEWAGVGVWFLAFVGETMADKQLKSFKARAENRGKVCQVGLWRYSRHPNYFFEWLIWVGVALYASASPYGWYSWYAPGLMLFFLLKVTGIPMTEELAVKTKGEAYLAYQRTTPSPFVPWFPRKK